MLLLHLLLLHLLLMLLLLLLLLLALLLLLCCFWHVYFGDEINYIINYYNCNNYY